MHVKYEKYLYFNQLPSIGLHPPHPRPPCILLLESPRGRMPGFLKSLLCGCRYAYACVRVCVCPETMNNYSSGVMWTLYDWLNKFCCFSVPFYGTCHRYSIGRNIGSFCSSVDPKSMGFLAQHLQESFVKLYNHCSSEKEHQTKSNITDRNSHHISAGLAT